MEAASEARVLFNVVARSTRDVLRLSIAGSGVALAGVGTLAGDRWIFRVVISSPILAISAFSPVSAELIAFCSFPRRSRS